LRWGGCGLKIYVNKKTPLAAARRRKVSSTIWPVNKLKTFGEDFPALRQQVGK
jgi:hypothetical protein